jgi:septal ring factor EnvC (AmiA/AmiB activator)
MTGRSLLRSRLRLVALALGCLLTLAAGTSTAQSSREAEQRLQRIRNELKHVAAERRELEGKRGDASKQLRAADEQVGQAGRSVQDSEHALARESVALADLSRAATHSTPRSPASATNCACSCAPPTPSARMRP